jgi:hypothetical protein
MVLSCVVDPIVANIIVEWYYGRYTRVCLYVWKVFVRAILQ